LTTREKSWSQAQRTRKCTYFSWR